MKTYFHGECVIYKTSKQIPVGSKKLKPEKVGYIVAPSETSGNHHVVECKDGVDLYEKDGIMYLQAEVSVDVFCVVKERHDTITLAPGVYEIEPAKEWDYISASKRNVAD